MCVACEYWKSTRWLAGGVIPKRGEMLHFEKSLKFSSTWIFFPKKVVLDLEKIRVSTSKKVSTFFCAKSITVIQVFGTTRYVQWHGVITPK